MPTDSTLQHWATLTGQDLAAKVVEKFREFEEGLLNRELDRMQLATYAYFGCDPQGNDTAHIGRAGKQNQIRILKDNEYRTAIRQKLALETADPAGFTPVPSNSDSDSQAAVVLTRGILDYFFDDLGSEKECYRAAEIRHNLCWAWVEVAWEENAGPLLPARPAMGPPSLETDATPAPMPGTPDATPPPAPGESTATPPPNLVLQQGKAGDVVVRHYLPTDVAFDFDARGETQYLITRRWVNKYDLAVQAPDQDTADRIRALQGDLREDRVSRFVRGWTNAQGQSGTPRSNSDEVVVLELRHRKTPGCPQGRWARVVGDSILLAEGPARYVDSLGEDDPAVYRIAAAERYGTPRAYSSAHDALGLQQAVDTLTSIPYSNQAAQGLNVIVGGEGTDLRPEDIREGLVVLYAKGDPSSWPKTLDLAGTEAQVFEFRKELKGDIDAKVGLNDQSMGRGPMPSSGSLAALLDDQTQRAVGPDATAYNELRRQVATGIIRRFQQFGEHSRTLPLTLGKTKRAVMGSFTKDDLKSIDRVKLETGGVRTFSQRTTIGQMIIDAKGKGLPIEPLITLLETGKWEPLIEDEHAEMLTIKEENERLLAGEALEPVDVNGQPLPPGPDGQPIRSTASILDNPWKHVRGHRSAGASPAARRSAIMGNISAHEMAHIRMLLAWAAGDPVLWAIHGPPVDEKGQPLAPPPPPMMEPSPSGGGKPPSGGKELPSGTPEGEVRPAAPPTNPSTGEQWSPTGAINNG